MVSSTKLWTRFSNFSLLDGNIRYFSVQETSEHVALKRIKMDRETQGEIFQLVLPIAQLLMLRIPCNGNPRN